MFFLVQFETIYILQDLTNHVFLHDDYQAFSYDEVTKVIEPITDAVKNSIVNVQVSIL